MGCASREGREDCLGHGGIGTGGRKEQLTEPQDVNLHSRDCTITFSYRSPANISLNLKAAQIHRCKDLPDVCYPNIGHEVVGNPRGNQFILEKKFLPVARNPIWMLERGSAVVCHSALVMRQFPAFWLLSALQNVPGSAWQLQYRE